MCLFLCLFLACVSVCRSHFGSSCSFAHRRGSLQRSKWRPCRLCGDAFATLSLAACCAATVEGKEIIMRLNKLYLDDNVKRAN